MTPSRVPAPEPAAGPGIPTAVTLARIRFHPFVRPLDAVRKKPCDTRGYPAAVIALTGRFWGVQGGGSSPLVEAPKAPDRRASPRRYRSQISDRVRLDVYRLAAHGVCGLGDRFAQGR